MTNSDNSLPLQGVRVLDLCEGLGDSCGRYLADLGADVILVEPPGGSPARQLPPLIDGHSVYFASHAINKQSTVLDADIEQDRNTFLSLAKQADILLHPRSARALRWLDEIQSVTEATDSTLVTLAISGFGDSGPYSDYQGSNSVHMAMAGIAARSGLKGREPLLPPGQLCSESASIQAAWVGLLGYWQRLHTGVGGAIDFSVFEASCQILDPALGVTGSAAGGQSATKLAPRGRPPEGKGYPFFRCADGYVRICVLNPRQWQAMSAWLGDDHPFTDPSFSKMGKRYKHLRDINALIAELFLDKTGEELATDGQRRGVPIAVVATPQEVLNNEHFTARQAFTELELAPGLSGAVPNGLVTINGERAGVRTGAPAVDSGSSQFSSQTATSVTAKAESNPKRRALEGIRVLDLGIIVAGAELGRLLADQGAEVIKIETNAYPDGLRQSMDGAPMTDSFAQGSRGKLSLGLNLRSEEGKRLFRELVAKSDIVLSNFKPGTMDSLGFGYSELKAINPQIIVSESSALGDSGPLSKSMGYGPLVRASSGLVGLWRYPDDEAGFGDALTIFPDHMAARVSATAVLAMLIRREHSGEGGTVSLAQAEAILGTLSSDLLMESLQAGSLAACGNQGRFNAPSNLFVCAGDDEWCAIDVESDDQWQSFCTAIERPDLAADQSLQNAAGRLARRDELEKVVSAWTQTRTPQQVTDTLQHAGIAAGTLRRIHELPDDPHLKARDFFRINEQPGLEAPLLTENGPASKSFLPNPEIKPAPFVGQHTRPLVKGILGLDDAEIDALIASGDLEESA